MPSYRPIVLEGLLLMEDKQLVLRMPDGGQWRLLAPGKHDHMLGHRVCVEGAREGHDIVGVDKIRLV